MNPAINREFNRLKNLRQNQGKNEIELKPLYTDAQINIAKKMVKADDKFLDNKEKKEALKLFEHYVGTYEFEAFTDLCTLNTLIYEEILLMRVQNHINELFKVKKDTYLDKNDREALHSIENRVSELKVKLGIDQTENDKDELSALQLLQKRFDKYINANRNEFTTVCAHCGKLLLLRKRVKDFDNLEHPWFAGRWLFNYEILKDCKEEKITVEQATRYLRTSNDYITWCFENWDMIVEHMKNAE